jgi:hypothetical protein
LGRTELRWAELMAFGVGEEAVEGTHDVAYVEGDGGERIRIGGGAGVEGFVGEGLAPVFDVLTGELEGVDDGAKDGGEVGVGSAEPGFGHQGTGYRCRVPSGEFGIDLH